MIYHTLLPRGKRGSCGVPDSALPWAHCAPHTDPSRATTSPGGSFWAPPCLITDPSPPGRGEIPRGRRAVQRGFPQGSPQGSAAISATARPPHSPTGGGRAEPSRAGAVPGPCRAEPSRACGAGGAASSPPPRLCGGADTRAGGGEAEVRQGRRRVGAGLGDELPSAAAAGASPPPPARFPLFLAQVEVPPQLPHTHTHSLCRTPASPSPPGRVWLRAPCVPAGFWGVLCSAAPAPRRAVRGLLGEELVPQTCCLGFAGCLGVSGTLLETQAGLENPSLASPSRPSHPHRQGRGERRGMWTGTAGWGLPAHLCFSFLFFFLG